MYVNVKDYGAVGDGLTDDTTAINAAITAITEGETLYFPAGTYATSAAIVIAKEINVIMDGTLSYSGNSNIAVLTISKGSGNPIAERQLVLRVTRENVSDWSGEDSISIKLVNFYQSDISIMEAANSTIGVQYLGDGTGFVYNIIRLFNLQSNKYGLDLANNNSGWCNENLFLGGRFTVGSSVHTTLARYGVRIRSIDDGYGNDQNIFEKPCFEIGSSTPDVESIPVLAEKAFGCYFNYCRVEGCGTVAMRDTYEGGNFMSISSTDEKLGMSIDSQVDDNAIGSGLEVMYWSDLRKMAPYQIFDSGPLFERAAYYGSSTLVHVPGMFGLRWSDGSLNRADYCDIYSDYIDYDGFLGVFVRTDLAKRFMIAREPYDYSEGTQVCIRPMDADMNILDGSGATRYVKWRYYYLGWQATQGLYMFSVDNNDDFYFEVTDDVKYVFIGVSRKYRSFTIFADKWARAFSPYDRQGDPNVAYAIPSKGTYLVGKRLANVTPASGQPKAWICTVAGTNDTISTTCTADGTAVVVVASADSLDVGQFISIDSGAALRILKINGTSITMSGTVTTGSGLTFVNSPATWVSEGNL